MEFKHSLLLLGDYFEVGFAPKEVYTELRSNPYLQFPKVATLKTNVTAIAAPNFKRLQVNQQYEFKFQIPKGVKVAIIDSQNKWTYFEKKDDIFQLNFTPKDTGKLKVTLQHKFNQPSFSFLLLYQVE